VLVPLFAVLGLAGGLAGGRAVAEPGWKLAYSDDFTGSALGAKWGKYGGAYVPAGNAWRPEEVSVSGGLLHLAMERRATDGHPFTSGGVGMWGLAQAYGRYTFRARPPAVKGIDSYITLWPASGNSAADATLVELLAHPAVPPGAEAAYLTIGYGAGKAGKTVPGRYADGFHDYTIEWTPAAETISVDGRVLLRSTRVTAVKRWIGFVMSDGDTLTGVPDAATPLPAQFQIGAVRVYAYTGETTPPPSPSTPPTPTPPPATTAAALPAPRPSATAGAVGRLHVAGLVEGGGMGLLGYGAAAVLLLGGGGLWLWWRRRYRT
jgi:beta-glucanase (GH16 family)